MDFLTGDLQFSRFSGSMAHPVVGTLWCRLSVVCVVNSGCFIVHGWGLLDPMGSIHTSLG
jgi:hypothetical protein